MVRAFVLALLLGLMTVRPALAQNQAVETCKTRATEAQNACQNAQNSSNNMAQVFIKLGIMLVALTSKGTQGGMCQMMAALSNTNANQLQSSLQPCQNAAASCKAACSTAASDTNTKSTADTTNLSAAQNNCQVAEKQGTAVNNDVMRLLDIAATAAVCLKELGMMKEDETVTTTAASTTLNCTDPANATNPICICQANPMAGGCGNTIGEVKKIEGGDPYTPAGTDAAPTPSQSRNDDVQGTQRSPNAKKADVPRSAAGAMPGADGGANPPGMPRVGATAPSGDANVLAGNQAGGGGNRGGGGGGYPEFVNTGSGLRPVARGPAAATIAFGPGGLLGKHRDLFKVVHKRYKAVFGGEPTDPNNVSP